MLELRPFLSERVWGGEKLKQLKNISKENFPTPLGETWEVSTHKEGSSEVVLRDRTIKKLQEFLAKELSYLVKFISCEEALSVQVHPGDEYAKINENSKGKTECWLILEALPGAGLYLGFKPGIDRNSFQQMINDKKNASEALNFYQVKAGDFFYVPHGTVHALGKGITLVEIQQASGVTYRVWDWNRVGLDGKPRELHIKKSFDVLNFEPSKNSLAHFHFKNVYQDKNNQKLRLVEHVDFKVDLFYLAQNQNVVVDNLSATDALVILDGEFAVENAGNTPTLKSYSSYLLNEDKKIRLKAIKEGYFLIVSE